MGGLMRSEQKKAEKKQLNGSIKHVANMVYYASAVHVFQASSVPPLADSFILLEQLDNIDSDLREKMKILYEQRKVDKLASFDLGPFLDFIDSAYDLKAPESILPAETQ